MLKRKRAEGKSKAGRLCGGESNPSVWPILPRQWQPSTAGVEVSHEK